MIMRFWIAALSLAALLFSSEAALADKRVAFVVGNGAYQNVTQLPNPPIDAKLMASTLRNVGFEVVEGFNLNRSQMADKLIEFGKKADGADIALFYYAGHGIAVNGTNYLLPIDANLKSVQDLTLRQAAFSVDTTMEETLSGAKVKLVFLDACRDNPFAEKATRGLSGVGGLAKIENTATGTLIAFATSPDKPALDGDKGNNSPFTRALVDNITQPGIEIQQAMTKVRAEVDQDTNKKQMPWGNTNLIGNVYLNPAAPADDKADTAKPEVQANLAPAGTGASAMELEFWRSVKDSNKVEELNAYITKYPDGAFKSIALARIETIKAGGNPNVTRNLTPDPSLLSDSADQVSEDQIGLSRDQRRDVQHRLTKLGFDVHSTGKFDDETRDVIKRWQAARTYPATGYLNKAQFTALRSENVAARVPSEDEDSSSSSDDSSSHVHHHRERESSGRVYRRSGGGFNPLGGLMRPLFGR
jgi:caspase domain-containing protein/putative peptidoglycan binding protein